MNRSHTPYSVIVIGAGPAGLTAGFFLAKAGVSVVVLESDPADVGGISRTVTFNGFGFDIGGHRFFSKSKEVEEFWSDLLPRDLLVKRRTSRIFYRNKFYSYPLRPVEALRKLGIFEAALCIFSYIRAKVNSPRKPRNFEEWISKQFGHRLFRIFFKSYTEKVWGLPCSQISADWAAQRIKGLSPKSILLHGLFPSRKDEGAKTLQETFRYPRKGPGMMWEACARRIREMGGSVLMGHRVERAEYDQVKKKWRVFCAAPGTCELSADHLISSAAIGDLLPRISPSFSPASKAAAASLKYRDFIIVGLVMNGAELFSDNWLYIHDPSVRMGRIQNFKSWSIEMLADPTLQSYGVEYFCTEGDEFWSRGDEDIVKVAVGELKKIGLLGDQQVLESHVIRQKKAYPVYDEAYAAGIELIKREVGNKVENLHLVGRNGMHRYNNQDHAVMTAMLTVRNILAGRELFDVWRVNQDAEYIEDGGDH